MKYEYPFANFKQLALQQIQEAQQENKILESEQFSSFSLVMFTVHYSSCICNAPAEAPAE